MIKSILVPLIAIPMKVSGYIESTVHFMKNWKSNSNRAFFGLTGLIALLGPILNIGTVRMIYEMTQELKLKPVVLGKSYLVGFSTTMFWSPYFASVALVLIYR